MKAVLMVGHSGSYSDGKNGQEEGRLGEAGQLQAKIGICILVDLQLKGQRVITG